MTTQVLPVGTQAAPHVTETSFSQRIGDASRSLYSIFKEAIQGFISIITFPARYFGSKTWSIPGVIGRSVTAVFFRVFGGHKITSSYIFAESKGYQEKSKELPKEFGFTLAPYANMVAFAHNNKTEYLEKEGYFPLDHKLLGVNLGSRLQTPKDYIYFNKESGLKILLTESPEKNEVVISFGALKSSESILVGQNRDNKKILSRQYRQVYSNYLGFVPALYQEADHAVSTILNSEYLKDKKVVLAGQCLGGSIAQYLSLKHKMKGYCFNSLPLGCGVQYALGQKTLDKANEYVTHVHTQGDFLNKNYKADKVASVLGFKTPGNFGDTYWITTPYKNSQEVHNNFLGSYQDWRNNITEASGS